VSWRIGCDSAVPIDNIEQTTTAGESGLFYDMEAGRYACVWKTVKAWRSATYRQFVMRLDDGAVHRADFAFK
jgi:hypothetical protein